MEEKQEGKHAEVVFREKNLRGVQDQQLSWQKEPHYRVQWRSHGQRRFQRLLRRFSRRLQVSIYQVF